MGVTKFTLPEGGCAQRYVRHGMSRHVRFLGSPVIKVFGAHKYDSNNIVQAMLDSVALVIIVI